jgi:hypothetical protein
MAAHIEQFVRDAGGCGAKCRSEIINYFNANPTFIEKDTIVYRGQKINNFIDAKTRNTFFSVSPNQSIAEDFAGRDGFLFQIRLKPGVQYISINDAVNSNYGFEDELLIRGGGTFTIVSRTPGKTEIIDIEYSNSGVLNNKAKTNKNTNKKDNKKANNAGKRTRKVSRNNIRKRARNEGLSENMMNNNILKMYLLHNESLNMDSA